MTDLVERLNDLAGQRHRDRGLDAVDDALRESASRISQQDAELERMRRELEEAKAEHRFSLGLVDQAAGKLAEAERHIELLQEKDASQCACSIDTPNDVCLFHVRMKAEARKAAFIEGAEIAIGVGADASNEWPGETWIAESISTALRAKAEETGT